MTHDEPLVKTIMGKYGEPEYTVIYHIHVTYDRCGWLQSTMSCNDSTLLLVDVRSLFSCHPVDSARKAIEHNIMLEENWYTSYTKSAGTPQSG